MKSIIVIPARLGSTRLPNKMLADIGGRPMLWHVYQRCLKVTKATAVHIATDSENIANLVRSWGGTVWLTDPQCSCGTERIVSILDKLDAEIIVNVQGDQPLLAPEIIDQLIERFETSLLPPDLITPVCRISSQESLFNPNVVKVTRQHDDYALYFSRHSIPYIRDLDLKNWLTTFSFWEHVGVYGYRRQVLEEYHSFPISPLEQAEKLEQLRFLQAGKSILTFETTSPLLSVDTAEDLEKVRRMVNFIK